VNVPENVLSLLAIFPGCDPVWFSNAVREHLAVGMHGEALLAALGAKLADKAGGQSW
jgi:hypothetical protein